MRSMRLATRPLAIDIVIRAVERARAASNNKAA
jgi:hypothetical protein